MNRVLNKYGKAKWINIRLSNPYKSRRFAAMSAMVMESPAYEAAVFSQIISASSGQKIPLRKIWEPIGY